MAGCCPSLFACVRVVPCCPVGILFETLQMRFIFVLKRESGNFRSLSQPRALTPCLACAINNLLFEAYSRWKSPCLPGGSTSRAQWPYSRDVQQNASVRSPKFLSIFCFCSVGAVTTMITEMLRVECAAAGSALCDAEATLLALGIHADTGDSFIPSFGFVSYTHLLALRMFSCIPLAATHIRRFSCAEARCSGRHSSKFCQRRMGCNRGTGNVSCVRQRCPQHRAFV